MLSYGDVRAFAESLLSVNDYRSEDHRKCEKAIFDWLGMSEGFDGRGSDWITFFDVMVEYFGFTGVVYRGIQLEDGSELIDNEFASFSKDLEVARMFAGYDSIHGSNIEVVGTSYVSEHAVTGGLDFHRILDVLAEVTDNDDLYDNIVHSLYEQEVIAPFSVIEAVEVM